jgi:hypothetical protein
MKKNRFWETKAKLQTFMDICEEHYEVMAILAFSITGDSEKSNKIVYQIFLNLWNENDHLVNSPEFHDFLYDQILKTCQKIN